MVGLRTQGNISAGYKLFIKLIVLSITITIILNSCETDTMEVNCEECYQLKPDSGIMKIRLTLNDENLYVPLVLFLDDIDDHDTDWVDTSYVEDYEISVKVGQEYSVAAYYKSGNKKIIAVDGDALEVKEVTATCEVDCWIFSGGKMDARLKYE